MINLNDVVPQNESVQKVLVVNSGTAENPTQAQVVNLPLSAQGAIVVSGSISTAFVRPTIGSSYIVSLDNILLLQGDGTFVAIPLNSVYTNLAQTAINNLLSSYKSAYSTLVSGVTAATLHYSKMAQNGTVTSETYNLKD